MKLKDAIAQLQQFADRMGDDAEFALYDRHADAMLSVDPDADRFDFEILRGEGEVVVEFN